MGKSLNQWFSFDPSPVGVWEKDHTRTKDSCNIPDWYLGLRVRNQNECIPSNNVSLRAIFFGVASMFRKVTWVLESYESTKVVHK